MESNLSIFSHTTLICLGVHSRRVDIAVLQFLSARYCLILCLFGRKQAEKDPIKGTLDYEISYKINK